MKSDLSCIDIIPSSFRDPSGFVFTESGVVKRFINSSYKEHYDFLISSGLKKKLQELNYLIKDDEEIAGNTKSAAYKILIPEQLPFTSYPYEWPFSALKDAALLTLKVQDLALQHGMTLKDASAFNVQFLRGKPILIDTLSFEILDSSKPWVAYRQFCQHFLGPLALVSKCSPALGKLSSLWIDGIPLETACDLLPWTTRLSPRLYFHLHLHAKSLAIGNDSSLISSKGKVLSLNSLRGMIDSLMSAVSSLNWEPKKSAWRDYYSATNYSESAFGIKKDQISAWCKQAQAKLVLDLGANSGLFSRLAAATSNCTVLSSDFDFGPVEINYRELKKDKVENVLPLVLDIINPSPAIGWNNKERPSFFKRSNFDLTLVLAVIHHLVIAAGIPLDLVLSSLAQFTDHLIIEFISKQDSRVQYLLASREDIFKEYNQECFEATLQKYFTIIHSKPISGTHRILYFAKKIKAD